MTHAGTVLACADLGVNGTQEQTYIAMPAAGCKRSVYSLRCFYGRCLADTVSLYAETMLDAM